MNIISNGQKDTEFGLIPQDWDVVRLNDIVDIYDKQRVPLNDTERQSMKGPYPYCGANGIVDYINKYIFDGEFVLLAEDGGYWGPGEKSSYVMKGKFWVNNHAHILSGIGGKVLNYYLHIVLNYQNLLPLIGGDARGKLTQAIMRQIQIPLPSIEEQRSIAYILSHIQQAIEVQDRIIAATKELKKALMQKLFTEGLHGEELKDAEIGKIPKSWDVKKIDEVYEFMQYGISNQCNSDSNGVPVLRIPNIIDGIIDLTELKYIQLPEKIIEKFKLINGDLIFVRTNGNRDYTGRCSIYQDQIEKAIFASYLIRTRLKEKILLPEFFYYYSFTSRCREFLSGQASGAADGKYNINTQTIKSALVPIPSISEQKEIIALLKVIDSLIVVSEKKHITSQNFFKSMLNLLMTGKVRVNDLEVPDDAFT